MESRRYPRPWYLSVLVLGGFLLVMATAYSVRAAVGNPGIIPPPAGGLRWPLVLRMAGQVVAMGLLAAGHRQSDHSRGQRPAGPVGSRLVPRRCVRR